MPTPNPIASDVIERPALTLPEAEADWVRELYGRARVILEYGSGGSTVLAAEMSGKTVFSVESDRAWADKMQAYFDAHPPASAVHLHAVDIGETTSWGRPANDKGWRRYPHYPISVWDRDDFRPPDVILIDGRFRPACLITAMLRIDRPTVVLFDDYTGRKNYHMVEDYVLPSETRGRMVRFDLTPQAFPVRDMARILEIFTRPG